MWAECPLCSESDGRHQGDGRCLPYAVQHLSHAYPALRPARRFTALTMLTTVAGSRLSPSNGWHYQPFAATGTSRTARAIAEVQVARKADAHLPQSRKIAINGDAFGRQSIIRADKRIDDFIGSDAQRGCGMGILPRNFHFFAGPANEIKIFTRL